MTFEANHGQTGRQVKFVCRGRGYTLFLTAAEAVLTLNGSMRPSPVPRSGRRRTGPDLLARRLQLLEPAGALPGTSIAQPAVLRMKFIGANPAATPAGVDELAGRSNYFLGTDPAEWRKGVPQYRMVTYRNLYPGVDLVFRGNRGGLEYDFLIAPGADPEIIRLAFDGAEALGLTDQGDLLAHTASGTVLHQRPVVWQVIEGAKEKLAGRLEVSGNELTFEVSGRDPAAPLVIDPAILYSTLVGGSDDDVAGAIALDGAGNAYVTGYTDSIDFPATAGAHQTANAGNLPGRRYEAFVTKINPNGSALIYSTYLGGDSSDQGRDIAVDTAGNAYVTGSAGPNFPTTPGALLSSVGPFGASFVAKLDPTGGRLVYSTFVGADHALAIAVDSEGNAHVTGAASPPSLPTTPGAFQTAFGGGDWDAFIAKLDPSGKTLIYSTYLGGSREDIGTGIAVDPAGNAYVTGQTMSANFPITPGAFQMNLRGSQDAFVAKLTPSGSSVVYSTYLGGSNVDAQVRGSSARDPSIAADSAGSAYVAGTTSSTDFPTTQGAFQRTLAGFQDVFVAKLNASGSALVYSTYLGGSATDMGISVAADSAGNALVTGAVGWEFPTTPGALQTCPVIDAVDPGRRSSCEAFLTKLNGAGTGLIYSTGLPGHGGVLDLALDPAGNAYLSGRAARGFQTTPGATQTSYGGGQNDAFVTKIELPGAPVPPPNISAGGIVDAATFGSRLAAGSVAALFGSNLVSSAIVAGGVPLPATLGNVTVRVNGIASPLFFVSPSQINFLVPWEARARSRASVTVTSGGAVSGEEAVNLAAFAPGIFSIDQRGVGQGAITIAATGEIAAPAGSIPGRAHRPARRNEYLSIYCLGLGPVTDEPASGAPASGIPLSSTTTAPAVTIGGAAAPVSFSGLAPGYVGLYQINAQVPANAPLGVAVPVVVSIGGAASNTVTIAVSGDGGSGLSAPQPIAPVNDAVIRQNVAVPGCIADPSAGLGFSVRFEWSGPLPGEQVEGYELWARRSGADSPAIARSMPPPPNHHWYECHKPIGDDSLDGWEWSVRARGSGGIYGPWSPTARFRFEPCRLADGRTCGAPPVGSFASTGSMSIPRAGHSATLLGNGRVLIAGGYNLAAGLPREIGSAELWDPQTGRFTATGSLRTARVRHQATLLADGRVLLTGGSAEGFTSNLSNTEIYDPATGQFTPAGSMNEARSGHAAVRLNDGRVLITGGIPSASPQNSRTAEIFDPATRTFAMTGPMTFGRGSHTATLLSSGQALIVGGPETNQAEVYDPSRRVFTPAGRLAEGRVGHTATLIPGGEVLIAGGTPRSRVRLAELFNPVPAAFFPAGEMATARWLHASTLLRNGWVLITGGRPHAELAPLSAAERFLPADRQFLAVPAMSYAREDHTSTLLADGRVLIVGGEQVLGSATIILSTAEIFTIGP